MIEREVLQRKPNVDWSSIAGLKEAKALLQEVVVLPNIVPDFFKVSTPAVLGRIPKWFLQNPR